MIRRPPKSPLFPYPPLFQSPAGPEAVNLSHRLIMNFVTAKKLAEVLRVVVARHEQAFGVVEIDPNRRLRQQDRKSTRLNSSHANISYAVFCLKKKNTNLIPD